MDCNSDLLEINNIIKLLILFGKYHVHNIKQNVYRQYQMLGYFPLI